MEPSGDRDDPVLTQIGVFSLLGGASYLIPFPFVDDWALDLTRRRMFVQLLRSGGVEPKREQVALLTGGRWKWSLEKGCLAVVFFPLKVASYVLGRLFRKIFFILALKSAADQAVRVYSEGYLLKRLIEKGWFDETRTKDENLLSWVHWAIEISLRDVNPGFVRSAMRRLFAGQKDRLAQAARMLSRRWRGYRSQQEEAEARLEAEKSILNSLASSVVRIFAADPKFLQDLEERLEVHIRRSGTSL